MKTLIVYASKYGCTKECAALLQERLQGDVTITTVAECRDGLEPFDRVVVGGSVYMGKIQKSISRFFKKHERTLLQKTLGLFASCYTPIDTEGYLQTLFPENLLSHAVCATLVGGRMDYEKMNFAYRKLFQSLKKIEGFRAEFVEPEIQMAEIQRLADVMNG